MDRNHIIIIAILIIIVASFLYLNQSNLMQTNSIQSIQDTNTNAYTYLQPNNQEAELSQIINKNQPQVVAPRINPNTGTVYVNKQEIKTNFTASITSMHLTIKPSNEIEIQVATSPPISQTITSIKFDNLTPANSSEVGWFVPEVADKTLSATQFNNGFKTKIMYPDIRSAIGIFMAVAVNLSPTSQIMLNDVATGKTNTISGPITAQTPIRGTVLIIP